jgi:hypothetical protein
MQANSFQEQAARDLRTYEGSQLSCCAGSEVYTNQRACTIELEVNPEVREISGCLDSFNLPLSYRMPRLAKQPARGRTRLL